MGAPGTAMDALDTHVTVTGHRLPARRKSHKTSSTAKRETFRLRQQGHLNLICVPRHRVLQGAKGAGALRDAPAFTRGGHGSVQHGLESRR